MTDMVQSLLHPFLERAATAGVVSGCGVGLGPAFDAKKLAVVAVTTLHEGRDAVEARLQNARMELSEYDHARDEAAKRVDAAGDISSTGINEQKRQPLLGRFLGWFRWRQAAVPGTEPDSDLTTEPAPPPVSRAFLVRKIRKLEALSRELLGIETDYTRLLLAQYESCRTRAASLPLVLSQTKGGE